MLPINEDGHIQFKDLNSLEECTKLFFFCTKLFNSLEGYCKI